VALVVEDDPDVREIFSVLLEESDLMVLETESGEEALELLEDRAPELAVVLADINLVGQVDGVTLARHVRRRWPEIALIVTSGSSERRRDLPEGVEFLAKPCGGIDILMATERARRASPKRAASNDAWEALGIVRAAVEKASAPGALPNRETVRWLYGPSATDEAEAIAAAVRGIAGRH
jgi:CheY-like chemotaxis protein